MKHENRRIVAFAGLALIWLCIGALLGYKYGYERGKKAVYNKVDSLLRKQKTMQTYTLPKATITVHDSPRTLPESRRVEQ
ncbi:hypothetical protein [Spirosoma spitsbergense]|uniref:hypothetical protein n=1 Tax=Spirosoma spitsbergense TaxID=431554 RepID=UPI000365FFC8|nr:hypothetical protein [Spirosoma spitsbergense]